MSRKKSIIQKLAVCTCVIALSLTPAAKQSEIVKITDEPVTLSSTMGTLINTTDADITIMPDKYNTGATGDLKTVGLAETVNGIIFVAGNEGTVNALDFPKRNPNVSGVVKIENIDFSSYPIMTYREGDIKNNIKVVFTNCKFSKITTGKTKVNISYEFNNCTFNSFSGSNAVFNNCMFGKSFSDGIVPFRNVTVNNCFFCDMASQSESGAGKHTDGTQIYGFKDIDVTDVYYNNCRFEVPAIQSGENAASINACIMLQMEFSNAKNMEFNKCTVNGGGYSIFARTTESNFTLSNVRFKDIKIGGAMLFGSFYPTISPGISFDNVKATQNLYIGSVWKENNKTHISVTNDTNQEKNLLVYADGSIYEYTIPACPNGSHLFSDYADYPFDIDVTIPKDCSYVVCFDNTIEGMTNQIRYENWAGKSVYLDNETKRAIYGDANAANDVVISGSCGKDVSYALTNSGVLTLSGTGATDNYHSTKLPPWSDYKYLIRQVNVEEGVDTLGTQIFSECLNLNTVVFADGIKTISSRAFYKCSTLQEITIPNTIENIADYAFSGTLIQNANYQGDSDAWQAVTVGKSNEVVNNNIVLCVRENDSLLTKPVVPLISSGECGKKVRYELTEDGVLRLFGEGETYNYHSLKVAPWFEYRDLITKVEISEGITSLGHQVFRQCRKLDDVTIPNSLMNIGNNAFIQCTNLKIITIPKSVKSIQRYAFHSTGLCQAVYEGTEAEWEEVYIGNFNEKLLWSISYLKQ